MTEKMMMEETAEMLQELPSESKLSKWNAFCDRFSYEDRIYDMEEFDLLFCGLSPLAIVKRLSDNFSGYHNYFRFTIYGAESTDYINDWINFEALAKSIIDGSFSE